MQQAKEQVAAKAIEYIHDDMIVGVGTGSTTEAFISYLAKKKNVIQGAVPSSQRTRAVLEHYQIPMMSLSAQGVDCYIDGADAFNSLGYLIKGGGGL